MGFDAAPQRAFGGDRYRIRIDPEGRDSQPVEMRARVRTIGKMPGGILEEGGYHGAGQRSLTHVSDRLIIDDVIVMTGAQQFEEIEAGLGVRGAEPR